MKTYDEKDYVDVVDGDDNPIEGFAHPVPKSWVGTDLLPAGAKAKGRSGGRQSSKDDAAKAAAEAKAKAEADAKAAAEAKAAEEAKAAAAKSGGTNKSAGDGGKKTEPEGS